MAAESKKHHFLTRSVLKRFQNTEGKLYVFDKLTEKTYTTNADNAGHENHFNSVEIEGKRYNFEQVFQDADSLFARLLAKIKPEARSVVFTPEEKYQLSFLTMLQTLRTKGSRQSIADFNNILKHKLLEWQEQDWVPSMTPEHAKLISLSNLQDAHELAEVLNSKSLIIMKAPAGHKFWISDYPVVMFNPDKTKRLGLKVEGTEVYYPIDKDLLLAFSCKTSSDRIIDGYNFCLQQNITPPDDIAKYARALLNGEFIEIAPENIEHFNWLQVTDSDRFLYASNDDFQMAKEVLAETPELKYPRNRLTTD